MNILRELFFKFEAPMQHKIPRLSPRQIGDIHGGNYFAYPQLPALLCIRVHVFTATEYQMGACIYRHGISNVTPAEYTYMYVCMYIYICIK